MRNPQELQCAPCGALAYAYNHLDEIETDLAADDEVTVKSRNVGGASQ